MRVAVLVPILGGAGLIQSISPLWNVPTSHVHLVSDYMREGELSQRYTHMTGPGGLLSGFFDLDASHYALSLDRVPEDGRSWELPVAIAHWVRNQGHEIVSELPDVVIWATGSLGGTGGVISESYHVDRKIKDSKDLLAELGCSDIIMLLPFGQNRDAAEQLNNVSFAVSVESLAGALDALGSLATRPLQDDRSPHLRPPSPPGAPSTGSALSQTMGQTAQAYLAGLKWPYWALAGGAGLALIYIVFQPGSLTEDASRPVTPSAGIDGSATPESIEMPADTIAAADWLRLGHHHFHQMMPSGRYYRAELHNPSQNMIRDISFRILNKEGQGLLIEEGFLMGPSASDEIVFNLHNRPEDTDAAVICVSGRPDGESRVYHEKMTVSSNRITGQEARFSTPFPECEEMDFTWQEYPTISACEETQTRLGQFSFADCSRLPEEAPGMGLMNWGSRDFRQEIEAAPEPEAIEVCVERVMNENFENESDFIEEAMNWTSFIDRSSWSEKDQIIWIGGGLMSVGQGGPGILERSAREFCLRD